MTSLPNLGRHDIDIDRKQAALFDRAGDGVHHRGAVAVGHGRHRVFHEIGALLVDLLELQGIERRFVVIAGPDVMHAAFAFDQ